MGRAIGSLSLSRIVGGSQCIGASRNETAGPANINAFLLAVFLRLPPVVS